MICTSAKFPITIGAAFGAKIDAKQVKHKIIALIKRLYPESFSKTEIQFFLIKYEIIIKKNLKYSSCRPIDCILEILYNLDLFQIRFAYERSKNFT